MFVFPVRNFTDCFVVKKLEKKLMRRLKRNVSFHPFDVEKIRKWGRIEI